MKKYYRRVFYDRHRQCTLSALWPSEDGILVEADAARGLETSSAGGKPLQYHSTNRLSGTSIANGFLLLHGDKNGLYRQGRVDQQIAQMAGAIATVKGGWSPEGLRLVGPHFLILRPNFIANAGRATGLY